MLSVSPKDIENQIISTIKRMGEIYQLKQTRDLKRDDKGWADADDSQGLITTAEALECIFIPYWSIPAVSELFWKGELIDLAIVRESIRYLVEGYSSDPAVSGSLGLSGTPYIDFTKKGKIDGANSSIKRNWDFLDAGSFVLCALLDAKAVQQHGQQVALSKGIPPIALIDPDLNKALDARIINCIRLIKECDSGPGSGWTFTNDKDEPDRIDFLYFTWNAIETLEVLAQHAKAGLLSPELTDEIMNGESPDYYCEKLLVAKLNYLSGRFLSPVDSREKFIGNTIVDFDGDKKLYYNLFSLASLLACGSKEKAFHVQALAFIINSFQKNRSEVLNPDYGTFELSGTKQKLHRWDWGERAFVPLLVKTIARFTQIHGMDATEELLQQIEDLELNKKVTTIDDLVEYYLHEIAQLKCSADGSTDEVWDRSRGYSIYFTERVTEALVRVYASFNPGRVSSAWDELDRRPREALLPALSLAGTPVIQIVVSADVVNEAIKEQVRLQIGNELIESLKNAVATDVAKQLEAYRPPTEAIKVSIDETAFVEKLKLVLNGLVMQIKDRNVDKDYEKIFSALKMIGSEINSDIERNLYNRLCRSNDDFAEKVSFESFRSRFGAFLDYLAGSEKAAADEESELDYNKLINEIFTKFQPKKKIAAFVKTKK